MSGKLKKLILLVLFFGAGFVLFADEVILGGQVYVQSRRSTPDEFALRKELYKELITLRNANRQRDLITLNMAGYREIMERIWGNARDVYRGQVRSIPICGELIPAEYQEPESKKEKYYKDQAYLHDNFRAYVKNFPRYNQLICVYFSLSQEIDELQKPLLDLSPETIYTMKNLEGRMEYLRERIPELTKAGQDIISEETGFDNRRPSERKTKHEELADITVKLMSANKRSDWMEERLGQYERILKETFNQAYKQYDGKVDILPVREEFIDRKYLFSEEKKKDFLASRRGWDRTFLQAMRQLPERERILCTYMRCYVMSIWLEKALLNPKKETPYPIDNLEKRLKLIEDLLPKMKQLEDKIYKMETTQKQQGEK